MNEQPDDWYEGLRDREENPDLERPQGIARDIKDEAVGRAKDKAVDAGKDLAKKAGKEAAKQGAKAGAEAGTSAAAGSGTATAAGAGIAATTGVETAGVGAAVGAAVAVGGTLLSNKTFRKILYVAAPLLALSGIFLFVAMIVAAPVVILAAIANSPAGQALEVAYDVRGTAINVATLGPRVAEIGLEAGQDLASDGEDWVEDNTPIDIPDCICIGATSTPHDPNSPQVLAAQTLSKDSRIYELSKAMKEKGFFKELKEKYGINVVTTGRYQFDIFLDGRKVHHADSVSAVLRFFASDERMQERMLFVIDQEHIYKYGKRVTFAESGMADYQSARLYIPDADKAKNDQQATEVKRNTIDTVNTPFFTQAQTELECTQECGEWVPTTVSSDQDTVTEEISAETGFLPKNTLRSIMNDRIITDDTPTDSQIIEWFNYVRELRRASRLTAEEAKTDSFVQGILNTRKQQSGRLWFNWQTQVDQLKAGKLTTKSGNTLFKSLANIGDSKAFHKLSGLKGGTGFREYEKINQNQPNPAKTIYDKWYEQNGEYAAYIDKMAGLPTFLSFLTDAVNQALINAFNDNAGIKKGLESAYKLGSEAMIPKCDSAESGTRYFNCIYAGAQASYRDIGISKLGADGKISTADYQSVLSYAGEVDRKVAAQKPLSDRLLSLDGSSSFARTALLNAVVPLQTSSSFVGFQSSITDMIAKIPSIFSSTLSPNTEAAIEDEIAMNNIDPAGIRVETLKNTALSATLNQSSGSVESCPEVQGENICKTDESVLLAYQAKYDLLPDEVSQFGSGMRIASFNILHSPDGDVRDRLRRSVDTLTHPPDGGPAVDVVGLQEVRKDQLNMIKSSEFMGDEYDFFPNTTGRDYEPNVIAWKKNGRFRPVEGEKKFINARYFHNNPEQMPVMKFEDTESGTQFYFASIHNPRSGNGRGENNFVRDANSRLFAEYFSNLKRQEPDAHMMLVGDFNAGYQAATNIEDIELGRRSFCILTNSIFWDAWHAARNNDDKCPKRTPVSYIDHIFLDRDALVSKFFVADRGLQKNGSDHPTIFADVGGGDVGSVAYQNPVYDGVAQDPAIIRGEDDTWHVYLNSGHDDPFKHLTSKDLVHWREVPGRTLTNRIEGTKAWAPDVAKTGDHYTIVFTGGTGEGGDSGDRWIGYATSPRVEGPFTYRGIIPGSRNGWGHNNTRPSLMLDPRIHEEGDQLYMTYGSGQIFIRKLKMNPNGSLTFDGNHRSILQNRTGTFTIEQSNIEKINNRYYLFYSAGRFDALSGNNEYSVRVARSENLMGPYTPDNGSRIVIQDRDGDPFDAPGTNDVIQDDTGAYWLIYNAFKGGERRLMLDRLNNMNDWPVANDGRPSSTRQQGPSLRGVGVDNNNNDGNGSNDEWSWPVDKRWWNSNRSDFLSAHPTYSGTFTNPYARGVAADIGDPPDGSPVYSMLGGRVVENNVCAIIIESNTSYGKFQIAYGHGTNKLVNVGDTVRSGQRIMSLGAVGCQVTGGHVHIDMALRDKHICPQDVFLAMGNGKKPNLTELTRRGVSPCGR